MSRKLVFLGCLILLLGLSSCSPGEGANPDVTAIAQTVIAEITETAAAAPTETLTVTPTETPTPTQELTPLPDPSQGTLAVPAVTPTGSSGSSASVTGCDIASFVSDISIPDGTHIPAGGSFTKTWQLRNDGTCTWSTTYKLVFHSGEQMNGPASKQLTTRPVEPGQTVNVSVNLVAPTADGSYYSYWIMQNDSGLNFGIGPEGGTFYLQIIVGEGQAAAPTTAATQAP